MLAARTCLACFFGAFTQQELWHLIVTNLEDRDYRARYRALVAQRDARAYLAYLLSRRLLPRRRCAALWRVWRRGAACTCAPPAPQPPDNRSLFLTTHKELSCKN